MREIAPGIYVEQGYAGGNVGFVATSAGPVLFDAPMVPDHARKWRAAIQTVTDKPPVYLVHTDWHKEHTLGNRELGGTIVAHQRVFQEIRGYSEAARQRILDEVKRDYPMAAAEIGSQPFALPELTFGHQMTLHVADEEIRLTFVGGHTAGASLIFLPKHSVLFAGDVIVNGVYPVMNQANSKDWLNALSLIRRMNPRVIVPGVGALCDASATDSLSTYIRQLRSEVRQQFQAGRSKSETVSKLRKAEHPRVGGEDGPGYDQQVKANISRVYDEMKGAAK